LTFIHNVQHLFANPITQTHTLGLYIHMCMYVTLRSGPVFG